LTEQLLFRRVSTENEIPRWTKGLIHTFARTKLFLMNSKNLFFIGLILSATGLISPPVALLAG